MGTSTFLYCMDYIKSFLNTQLPENMKIKLISESRVLQRVNPRFIFVVLYQRKWTEWKQKKITIYNKKNITIDIDQDPINQLVFGVQTSYNLQV